MFARCRDLLAIVFAAALFCSPGSPSTTRSNQSPSACSSVASSSAPPVTRRESAAALEQLKQDTGATWKPMVHGTVLIAASDSHIVVTPPDTLDTVARRFLAKYHNALSISDDPSPELALSGTAEKRVNGRSWVYYKQQEGGILVDGASVSVVFDATYQLYSVSTSYIPGLRNVCRTPLLDSAAAKVVVARDAATRFGLQASKFSDPELVFLQHAGSVLLAYRFNVAGSGGRVAVAAYRIDANSGAIMYAGNAVAD